MATDSAPSDLFAASLANLEATMKWVIAALAGVAAALLGGIPLTRLGSLTTHDAPRLGVAVVFLLLAGAGLAMMLKQTSSALSGAWLTLSEISDQAIGEQLKPGATPNQDLAQVLKDIQQNRDDLYAHVAATLPELHERLHAANEAARNALVHRVRVPPPTEIDSTGMAADLRSAATSVVAFANYRWRLAAFRKLKRHILVWSIVTTIGVVGFAYATSPPAAPTKVIIQKR